MNTNSSQSFSEDTTSDNVLSHQQNHQNVIKGRHRFAFWVIVSILLLLTIGNLILTMTIIGVLRITKGMENIEMIPQEQLLKLRGNIELDKILYKGNGNIESFEDEGMEILGDDAGVVMKVIRGGVTHSRIILDNDNGISIKEVNNFEVKDAITGDTIFNVHKPQYNFPEGVDNLITKEVTAKKISSAIENPLHIHSDKEAYLSGAEGIRSDSEQLLMMSGVDSIVMNSTQGGITLDAFEGIFLNIDKIPVVRSEYGIRTSNMQYKICVCMPKGQLFRIPIPRSYNSAKISCLSFSSKDDPCQ